MKSGALVSPPNIYPPCPTFIRPADDASLSNSRLFFLLVEVSFPRGITNQKHYPDAVFTRHQYGISALVSQTSFRGETSGGVAKCRLFSSGYDWSSVDKSWYFLRFKRKKNYVTVTFGLQIFCIWNLEVAKKLPLLWMRIPVIQKIVFFF